jgi:signal transduction histidine kinase
MTASLREGHSVFRSTLAGLGPSLFGARDPVARPAATKATELEASVRPETPRLERLAVIALGLAGVLPPLAFTARPGELGFIGAVPVSVVLTGLLILAPALVGLIAALAGIDSVREGFHTRADKEPEHAVLRVLAAAAAVAYALIAAAVPAARDAAAAGEIVSALGLAGAWVLLVLTIVDPAPSVMRRMFGFVYDALLLSALLHFGSRLTVPWFWLYLLLPFYAGLRFGLTALTVVSVASVAGFAAVVATTAFWQEQALLAGGVAAAMVVLPGFAGVLVRAITGSRQAAAAAQSGRTRFLTVVSQALREPLDVSSGDRVRGTAGTPSRALLSQLNNVLDFAAIEAGIFIPRAEPFDLHRVLNDALAERRAAARARGEKLRVHIDPALPYRLRGWPHQLAQIVDNLLPAPADGSGDGRLAIASGGTIGDIQHLRLTMFDAALPAALADAEAVLHPSPGTMSSRPLDGQQVFRLAVVKRLVELMGGDIVLDHDPVKYRRLTITLPLELDQPATDGAPDLSECLPLIASEDSQFVSEIAEPLHAWHGDPRWIDGFDGMIGFADGRDGACSVLIVDARTHVLAALSFAHRAANGASPPSFILAVAEPAQFDGFIELSDGEVDVVLPAPLDSQRLANALHSLPLWSGAAARPVLVPDAEGAAPSEAASVPVYQPAPAEASPAEPQVTPISAHPRFTAETPVLDAQALAALRRLGGDDAFLEDVIGSFRADAAEIMQRIVRAAAMADADRFARGLHALRNCAANLGGLRLCEVILALREIGARELREQGTALTQRLADELARLEAALAEHLSARGQRQRG